MNIKAIIGEFLTLVENGEIEIYNEFSVQHELGILLRERLPEYTIQFERNARFFNIDGTIKHEIDIVIYNDAYKCAIELKFPLNGQYPEEMFSFIKDIKFMEEMREHGFDETYCLTLVEGKGFYSGDRVDGIYSFFRASAPIKGIVNKPTGKRDEQITLNGSYDIVWKDCGKRKYYLLEI